MSYHVAAYKMIPTEPFKITRGCAGCGCKQTFACKDHFRVNANGSRLDVWLIYGCEKCGHTYNLPVYERISPSKIPEQEYSQFLSNDKQKVLAVGTNKAIFMKNKAEIAWDLSVYETIPVSGTDFDPEKDAILLKLYNPYDIPVRTDKIAAGILGITRSAVKERLHDGRLSVHVVRNERE